MDAEGLREIERARLRALVAGDRETADPLHAEDFRIVTPSGLGWSKEEYLGGIASGFIDYRRFEAVSEIEVMIDGGLGVVKYRSAIEISVDGNPVAELSAWHLDVYRVDVNGLWQVRWSQATAVE
ncbi:nuclear transport factor 2 family protein [Kribbella sp. NPDC051770]|uniref:nuclear transport factor 2 family protein n=1 Tax=Kribbella sp. NPDC051770 TaxID=3155413 RepID=UPI003413B029